MTMVVKKSGGKQKFDKQKIVSAIKRAGAGESALKIANYVERRVSIKQEVDSSQVRELVIKELQKEDHDKAKSFGQFKKAVRKFSKQEEFLENRLIELVGDCGRVKSVYGGFHIQVTDEKDFDYAGVFRELLSARQTISIEKQDENLVINAK